MTTLVVAKKAGQVAIAADTRLETKLPQLDLNDHQGIAAFIMTHQKLA